MDSQRWQQERVPGDAGRGGSPYQRDSHKVSRHPDASLVAYQDSQTHAARQHWGPTESYRASSTAQPRQSYSSQQYASSEHYTTTPTPAYGSSTQSYQVPPAAHAAPRTQPTDPYAYSQQPGARDHPTYATQQYTSSYQQPPVDQYGRTQPPPPSHAGYTTPRYFGYFDDRFLVYR